MEYEFMLAPPWLLAKFKMAVFDIRIDLPKALAHRHQGK